MLLAEIPVNTFRSHNMKRYVLVMLLSLIVALPAFGKNNKSNYTQSCSDLWPAVKDTLSNPNNYTVTTSDDAKMHADYDVKHTAHVNISGALLQRTNHVTLVPKGTGCQMQVESNYSGWEHNDSGDFKSRVDESLAKLKGEKPADTTKTPEANK
jgi:hypothetical protein